MSKPKRIFDSMKTVRIYGADYSKLSKESRRTGVPIVKIVQRLVSTLDISNEKN